MIRVSIKIEDGDVSGIYDIVGCSDYVNIECRKDSGKYTRSDRNYHSSFCVHRLIPLLEENYGVVVNQYKLHEVYRNELGWSKHLMSAGYMNSVGRYSEDYHTIDDCSESMVTISLETLRSAFDNYMDSLYVPKKMTLDNSEYDKMVLVVRGTNKRSKGMDLTCGICLDDLKVGNRWAITKCNHGFHPKCIKRWLTKECIHPKCPMCNMDVRD